MEFKRLLEYKGTISEYHIAKSTSEIICFSEKIDHWSIWSATFLTGVMLHILYSEENPTFEEVLKFLNTTNMSLEEKLRAIILFKHSNETTLFKEIYDDVVKITTEDSEGDRGLIEYPQTHPIAAKAAVDMLIKSEKERVCILWVTLNNLSKYSS